MMEGEEDNTQYAKLEYWNNRFEQEDSYDWLVKLAEIEPYLIPKIPSKESRILIVGCGNSTFSSDLYDYGFENITNIDFSEVCIRHMKEKNKERRKMSWDVMDMTELTYEEGNFDVVIDKASMDALMVEEGDVWDPERKTVELVDRMSLGISRVLKPGGLFIQITFAQTHFRTKYLMAQHILQQAVSPFSTVTGLCPRYNWSLSFENVNPSTGCINYFVYTMQKLNL